MVKLTFLSHRSLAGCVTASLAVVSTVVSASAVDLLQGRPTGVFTTEEVQMRRYKVYSSYSDIRVSLGIVPGISRAEMAALGWNGTVICDEKTSAGMVPSYALGFVGPSRFVLGATAGLPLRSMTGDASNGQRFSVLSYGVELAPFIGYVFGPLWNAELSFPCGAGYARHVVPDYSTSPAHWWSTGIRLGAYRMVAFKYQMGFELGYLSQTTLGKAQSSGGGSGGETDVIYRSRGVTASVSVGYRFQ